LNTAYCAFADRPEPTEATIYPDRLEISIGEEAEFRCHVTGSRSSDWQIEWSRERGDLPISAVMRDGVLRFQASSVDQQGRYVCSVVDDGGRTVTTATSLLVIHAGTSGYLLTSNLTWKISSSRNLRHGSLHPKHFPFVKHLRSGHLFFLAPLHYIPLRKKFLKWPK